MAFDLATAPRTVALSGNHWILGSTGKWLNGQRVNWSVKPTKYDLRSEAVTDPKQTPKEKPPVGGFSVSWWPGAESNQGLRRLASYL